MQKRDAKRLTARQREALVAAEAIVATGRVLTISALADRLDTSILAAMSLMMALKRSGHWTLPVEAIPACRGGGDVKNATAQREKNRLLNAYAATLTIDEWIEYTRPALQGVR